MIYGTLHLVVNYDFKWICESVSAIYFIKDYTTSESEL